MDYIIWKDDRISKLVLGTAQLGMNYGIANVQGQPTEKQACAIVEKAFSSGVNCFDTAQAYGNSEVVLGKALKSCGAQSAVKIVSKLSPALGLSDSTLIERAIEVSCKDLGVDRLWCWMLHRAEWLEWQDEGLHQMLTSIQKCGLVKYLGVSVYSPDDAHRALEHPDVQIVQISCNAWDQRVFEKGIFDLAKKKGKLCFVRGVFLQGLLLLSPEEVSKKLPMAKRAAQKWHVLADEFDMGTKRLSMRFALSLNVPLIVGVENVQQLEEDIKMCEETPLSPNMVEKIQSEVSPFISENIVNPTSWVKVEKDIVLAIIQARMGSTRLPGKVLMPMVDGKVALELMLERLLRAQTLDKIVVATTTSSVDDRIVHFCERLGYEYFRGSEEDVLDRYYCAFLAFGPAQAIVRLTGDCPLHDPVVIDKVVNRFLGSECEYVSNINPPTYPNGLDVEVFSFSALERVWKQAKLKSEREHVTAYLRKHLDVFKVSNVECERDLSDKRWTLDEKEDYEFTKHIYKNLYKKNPAFGMEEVLEFLEKHPKIEEINRHIPRDAGYHRPFKEDEILDLYNKREC